MSSADPWVYKTVCHVGFSVSLLIVSRHPSAPSISPALSTSSVPSGRTDSSNPSGISGWKSCEARKLLGAHTCWKMSFRQSSRCWYMARRITRARESSPIVDFGVPSRTRINMSDEADTCGKIPLDLDFHLRQTISHIRCLVCLFTNEMICHDNINITSCFSMTLHFSPMISIILF